MNDSVNIHLGVSIFIVEFSPRLSEDSWLPWKLSLLKPRGIEAARGESYKL